MFGRLKPQPELAEAAQRVAGWTRERLRLPQDAIVSVSEVVCELPGCPPLETVIAFWTGADQRHHYKIFKPLRQIVADDLPPWWMRDALSVPPDYLCDCC